MTCIVGISDGKNVWMGGDTCASDKFSQVQIGHSKVFYKTVPCVGDNDSIVHEKMVLGGCGMFRMMQLLEHGLSVPQIQHGQSVIGWLTIQFADEVRKLFKSKGFSINKEGSEFFNGSFLLGFRGELYHVEDSYQAICVPEHEYSCGSGAHFAFGSLHTTRKMKWEPEKRVMTALEVAAELNPQTRGPFDLKRV
jgi:hypothetical protein